MMKFFSSFKLKKFTELIALSTMIPKISIFFQGGLNFGGRPENLGKIENNRDIYCYANQGW